MRRGGGGARRDECSWTHPRRAASPADPASAYRLRHRTWRTRSSATRGSRGGRRGCRALEGARSGGLGRPRRHVSCGSPAEPAQRSSCRGAIRRHRGGDAALTALGGGVRREQGDAHTCCPSGPIHPLRHMGVSLLLVAMAQQGLAHLLRGWAGGGAAARGCCSKGAAEAPPPGSPPARSISLHEKRCALLVPALRECRRLRRGKESGVAQRGRCSREEPHLGICVSGGRNDVSISQQLRCAGRECKDRRRSRTAIMPRARARAIKY